MPLPFLYSSLYMSAHQKKKTEKKDQMRQVMRLREPLLPPAGLKVEGVLATPS